MGVRLWMRLFATTLLVLSIQAGTALADQSRPGRPALFFAASLRTPSVCANITYAKTILLMRSKSCSAKSCSTP